MTSYVNDPFSFMSFHKWCHLIVWIFRSTYVCFVGNPFLFCKLPPLGEILKICQNIQNHIFSKISSNCHIFWKTFWEIIKILVNSSNKIHIYKRIWLQNMATTTCSVFGSHGFAPLSLFLTILYKLHTVNLKPIIFAGIKIRELTNMDYVCRIYFCKSRFEYQSRFEEV